MVTALGNGAAAVIPVAEIAEALALRAQDREVLLAGERDGVRIPASLTGSIAFNLGNSPREFTTEKVRGRTIVMTTTNGTRALRACAGAKQVLAASFLNLQVTAEALTREAPEQLLLLGSGTYEEAAYEDILGAGALCDLLWSQYERGAMADSARVARRLFQLERTDLAGAFAQSRNGSRLLAQPELRDDVPFCLRRDTMNVLAQLGKDGRVTSAGPS
jgi:2-phosphosulfolactate phosphatase